ncbi:DUF3558 family protein [Nesterenkonia sp. MY13]|uniref:DUF3558 family protein n=1 Tax=Nesterenkonia sedimenti TaxID=1463632 RepID=A0A7X8TIB1_9MICC|nr:DUF3558 family protein [Nesterenkonia sedimenti]NLS08852.1 DUF3558 family protein [Nesterenkonia sedimenti]
MPPQPRTTRALALVGVIGLLAACAEEDPAEEPREDPTTQDQESPSPQESPEEEPTEDSPGDFIAPGGEGGASLESACDLLSPAQLEEMTGAGPYQDGESALDTIGEESPGEFTTCQWESPENPDNSILLRIGSAEESEFLREDDDEPVEIAGAEEAAFNTELSRITWSYEDTLYVLSQSSREPADLFDTEVFIELAETVMSNHS